MSSSSSSSPSFVIISSNFILKLMEVNKIKSSKKRKREEDRLSILPEPVLHHILSFLDMRFVIQSSLLSKTWRTIWTTVPFLNFDYKVYDEKRGYNFVDFVDKTLLFRGSSNIQIFRINSGSCYLGFDFAYGCCLYKWIDLVARSKVQVLDLEFNPVSSSVNLAHYLFTCKSLVKLKIKILCISRGWGTGPVFSVFSLPDLVNLPNIKTLHFHSLPFSGTKFFQQLFLCCPSLETLIMINCGLDNVNTVTISVNQLKHLEIDNFYSCRDQTYRSECEITIFTPHLTSLVCTFDILNKCSLEGLTSLVKGDILVELPYFHCGSIEELKLSSSWKKEFRIYMKKTLQGLANAKSLNLSALLLEVLPKSTGDLPMPFPLLKQLKLTIWFSKNCIRSIKCLLEMSFNLETLLLQITHDCCSKRVTYPYCNETQVDPAKIWEYWQTDLVLDSNLCHLKFVEIWNIRGCVNELEFLKLLLKNAISLEKMTIFTWQEHYPCRSQLKKFRDVLLSFPRASSSIAILFF